MHALVLASLGVNVAVLIPVTAGLLRDAEWARRAFGPKEHGRQILLAIYLAILLLSLALLAWQDVRVAIGLFLAQVVYKVLTPLTVGTLRHPVVLSNLAIAALHATTIASVW